MGAWDLISPKLDAFNGYTDRPSMLNKAPGSGSIYTYPWATKSSSTSKQSFFPALEIDGARWDKLYPYRLLVVEPTKNGTYSIVASQSGKWKGSLGVQRLATGDRSGGFLVMNRMNQTWVYNFPISFQAFSITDQYAIDSAATLNGIGEQHNGVKFKMIAAQGTVGVWPYRKSLHPIPKGKTPTSTTSSLGSIFAGTLEKASGFVKQATKVAAAFNGSHPALAGANLSGEIKPSINDLEGTGYYQILLMGQFLERYAELKKLAENKNWRLALDIPKQNQTFLVTPIVFSLQQSAQKPMEYTYQFQLKAWKRVKVNGLAPDSMQPVAPAKLDSNFFLRAVNTLRQTRKMMSAAANTIMAVRSDFSKVMNLLRQAALVYKDASGVVLSAAELPGVLANDLKQSIRDAAQAINDGTNNFGAARQSIKEYFKQSNTVYGKSQAIPSWQTDASGTPAQQSGLASDPINTSLNDPDKNFELFDAVSLSDINMTPNQQAALDQEIETVKLMRTDDFRTLRNLLQSVAFDLTNSFGSGDQTYADTYGKADPTVRAIPMTEDENDLVTSIFDTIQELDVITSNMSFDDERQTSPVQYVADLAAALDIPFEQTANKKKVPVPFNFTIEEIAARYLGDRNKWLEIATLNGLRSPYIDEAGFTLPLLSNGDGRQFVVDDTLKRLYLGQTVLLRSTTVPPFTRKITAIDFITAANTIVTVDGLDNLDSLKLAETASLTGYLPGTVNSQSLIWIPTDEAVAETVRANQIPFLPADSVNGLAGIDFLLDDQGDLAMGANGDFRLSTGITNLIQAIKIKLGVEKGSMLLHPEFGISSQVGGSVADLTPEIIYSNINECFKADARFAGVKNIQVALNGPTLSISMEVEAAGSGTVIPVNFTV